MGSVYAFKCLLSFIGKNKPAVLFLTFSLTLHVLVARGHPDLPVLLSKIPTLFQTERKLP